MRYRWIRNMALLAMLGFIWVGSSQVVLAGSAAMLGSKTDQARSIFPEAIDGWKLLASGSASGLVSGPASRNPSQAAALQEFGLKQTLTAQYRQAGVTLSVQALVFPDATGSYGAFTLLHTPGLEPLRMEAARKPARQPKRAVSAKQTDSQQPVTDLDGAHLGQHWLLLSGKMLLQADFSAPVPDELLLLRSLEQSFPRVSGPSSVLPTLPDQLPRTGLDLASVRYAVGPIAYRLGGGVLPVELIHFEQSAEAVTAQYGKGQLTLLSYPTPEIADARMGAIAGALAQGAVAGTSGAVLVKRAGMTVAVTSGGFTPEQARDLLAQIRFEANLSVVQLRPKPSEIQKTAKLLDSIVLLVVILGGASILLGLFFGGGRALYRVARGKSASSMNDQEFVHLDLREPRNESAREPKDGPPN